MSMRTIKGVVTSFRSASRLIGAEVAATSGSQEGCIYASNAASSSIDCVKPNSHSGSGILAAYLRQTRSQHCTRSETGFFNTPASRQAYSSCHKPWKAPNTSLTSVAHACRQQHSFRAQAPVKSLWQRDYYSSGLNYGRSYSIWDGDNALYGLIAANLAGFLLWQSYPGLMYRHATVSVKSIREGRVYTLLTSAFSHNAFSHILANMLTFYFFGRSMSRILGGKKVGPVYSFAVAVP